MKWYMEPFAPSETNKVRDTVTIRDFFYACSTTPPVEGMTHYPFVFMYSTNAAANALINRINNALGGNNAYSPVDSYIRNYFGSRELFPQYSAFIKYPEADEAIKASANDIYSTIDSVMLANKYKYEKYLAILELEYNPIWNVDSDETATEDRGARDETDVKGAVTTSYNYGQDRQHFYKAPETTDNTYNKDGAKTTTSTKNGSETIERSNTQMNDLSFKSHDKEVRTPTNMTDTVVEPTYTNSSKTYRNDPTDKDDISTRDARNDSESKGAQTNTHTAKKYTDETHIVRQGNIGTKTTQSMIEEEKAVAKFYLMKEVAKDIVNSLTFGIYY